MKTSCRGNNAMYDFSMLRELRKNAQLTIEDISARSGISPAVISKLERNQCVPELETIYKLGRIFGMNPSELLRLAESSSAHKICSSRHTANGFHFKAVNYGNIRCLYGSAKKGSRTLRPEIHKDDYELCWVLSGSILCRLPHEKHELHAGDAIQFDALLEHAYEVTEDCELIILHIRKGKRF